ncbi:hypothetical protein PT077_03755 [Erysipelothrix rhusiopathiae]|nr:hypothetical protein [Erysipelothrix rhusiopathiae]
MISKAVSTDKKELHILWKDAFPNLNRGSVDAYFNNFYRENQCYLAKNNHDEILAAIQVHDKVLSLHDKNIKVSYLVGSFMRPNVLLDTMSSLIETILDEVSKTDIITLCHTDHPEWFEPFGFETVVENYIYTIPSVSLPSLGMEGIVRDPSPESLLEVYRRFTSHFTGNFVRDENYFGKLKKTMREQNGQIIGLQENGELIAYAIVTNGPHSVEVLECCYDKSGSLVRLLAFVSRSVQDVRLHATVSERLDKIFTEAQRVKAPFLIARVNDKELFERLYHIKIISAYSAFHAFGKPLFNRDFL